MLTRHSFNQPFGSELPKIIANLAQGVLLFYAMGCHRLFPQGLGCETCRHIAKVRQRLHNGHEASVLYLNPRDPSHPHDGVTFIQKPFTPRELLSAVAESLRD